MKPTKSSNNKITNCTPTSSECIIWEGPNLDCIETCHGDTVGDIIKKITDELCALRTENDLLLTIAQLGCLPIKYNTVAGQQIADLTLKTTVLTLIEEHCSLVERVDFLSTPAGSEAPPSVLSGVNISCIKRIPTLESGPGTLTDENIVQYIVQGLCITYNDLQTNLETIYSRLDALGTGTGTGTVSLPTLSSSCIGGSGFTNKSISVAWGLFDADYCAYKAKLGSITEIDAIITAESSCLTTLNDPTTGLFIPQSLSPLTASTTQAHAIENLWKTVCALNAKVAVMNDVLSFCCGFSCKKFEVGVTAINFDSTTNEVDLRFSFDGSSTLPTGTYDFVDKGSTVIFTDSTGYAIDSKIIDITDSSSYTGLDITGLDLTGEIQVDVDLEYEVTDPITGNVFNCTKCLHTYFKTGSACAFCTLNVTISGDNPLVKIIYTVDGNTQTLLIAEETLIDASYKTYILPSGATITSIINVNNSIVTIVSPDCPNLVIPTIDTLACYSFLIDEDFFNLTADDYFYNITGFMVNGEDVVTYSPGIRADLTNARYTEDYSETEETCSTGGYVYHAYNSDATFGASVNSLRDIQPNDYVMAVSRVCGNAYLNGSTPTLRYNNIIVRAIAGKNIFLKLTARDNNLVGVFLGNNTDVYIKGNEIPLGNDCDCCYVKTGN